MNASMKQIMKATTGMTEMASELYRYDSKQEIQHLRKVRCWRKTALLNKQMMQLLVKADEDESIKSKSRRGSISFIRRRLQNVEDEEEEEEYKEKRLSTKLERDFFLNHTPSHQASEEWTQNIAGKEEPLHPTINSCRHANAKCRYRLVFPRR